MKQYFPQTDIYAITDSGVPLGRNAVEQVRQMLAAGVHLVQYREKHLSKEAMLEECRAIRALTKEAGCCFIVNDHLDIALLCNADGVHVGQNDIPLDLARQELGPNRLVGVSARSVAEAKTAIAGGADYIGIGAIYGTATKADATLAGISLLDAVASFSSIPYPVIGGINEQTLPEVIKHKARCFCMVSAITLAPDIPARVAALRRLIQIHSEACRG